MILAADMDLSCSVGDPDPARGSVHVLLEHLK